jgi:undecaprenyl-diphosphatase
MAIVVNPSAGPLIGRDPAELLRELLPAASIIEPTEDDDIDEALEQAAAGAAILGVAGGDGTVNTAAGVALAHSMPLAVVPGGTLNHFAHELGLRSVADSAEAIETGRLLGVDVGDIAGRPFLNTASLGGYPELVDLRDRLEHRIGKWPAMVVALVQVLRKGAPVRLELDGEERRIWIVFVGNCRYRPSGFAPRQRPRMDDGLLDVRVVDARPRYARTRLVVALLTGRLKRCSVYEERVTRALRVRSLEGPLRLARDGETFDGPPEFTISKRAEQLAVVAPATG